METIIDDIIAAGEVETPDGEKIPLHSAISREEGSLLLDLIRNDPSICKTLEIGCAYGLSSLFIVAGLAGRPAAHHTIIDPFQYKNWKGVGIHNLKRAGFEAFTLVEKRSEFALPEILESGEEAFDLVFIDGFHTFDHTLVDCFYATRLLRPGGYLVVDDVSMPSIRKVLDYLLLYPCYSFAGATTTTRPMPLKKRAVHSMLGILPQKFRDKVFNRSLLHNMEGEVQSMVALRKTAPDKRSWSWFSGNF